MGPADGLPVGHAGFFGFLESFESWHLAKCDRCRRFAVDNVEMTPRDISYPAGQRNRVI
jgi:hypothetical protein